MSVIKLNSNFVLHFQSFWQNEKVLSLFIEKKTKQN